MPFFHEIHSKYTGVKGFVNLYEAGLSDFLQYPKSPLCFSKQTLSGTIHVATTNKPTHYS